MVAAFAPVEAGPGESAPGARRRRHALASEKSLARSAQLVVEAVRPQMAGGQQLLGEGHSQPAGEMVVTRTRETQPLAVLPGGEAARGPDRGERGEPLEQRHDRRVGQAVITVAAVFFGNDQAAGDQLAEMEADGRRAHPGLEGQLAGRQRAAVGERPEQGGAGRVGEQGGGSGDVGVGVHGYIHSSMTLEG